MALIPPETIEAIRSKLDIVELVSEYVPGLSRAGRNMKGRCPFHQERTPSFIVSPERQTFHCFGCGEGGDAFTFVRKIENLSFGEAAEKLAERVGIKIETQDEVNTPEQRERVKLRELMEFAAAHYHAALSASDAAAARQYFAKRHLDAKTIEAFQLGFASRNGNLVEAALKKGFTKEQLVKAGLAAVRDGRAREYFFDRVLFPIRDAKGVVVAFGGRTMGDGEPKYLNSPETPLFSKSRVLYALSQAAPQVRKARQMLLMEGYMDVIASHQHGIATACAPLGTALTPEHVALVKRYASDVVIVFDADNAGINAAIRGAELLLAAGLSVRIASVPSGKDPDEHLHAFGAEAFKTDCLAKAVDLVEFKTELLIKRAGPLTPQAKSAIAKDVLATIAQCPDEILKSEWTRRLSQRLDVGQDALQKQLGKTSVPKGPAYAKPAPQQPAELTQQDEQLLVLLLKDARLAALVEESDLASAAARTIWKGLKDVQETADWSARLLEALPPAEKTAASRLLVLVGELQADEPDKVLKSILTKRRGLTRLKEIEPKVAAGDVGLKDEYLKLLAELKGSRR